MAGLLEIAGIIYTLRLDRLERTDQVSVSVHARSQFRGRFCSGMIAPGGGSKAGGMRRMRWGSDFGAA
jgi:hypothetical protein